MRRSPRGEAARNERGSAADRRARRLWLIVNYRADLDVAYQGEVHGVTMTATVGLGGGEPACRCYRCGQLLTLATLTVDRIIPGCQGGTYRRTNIRPACSGCNSETGSRLYHDNRKAVPC